MVVASRFGRTSRRGGVLTERSRLGRGRHAADVAPSEGVDEGGSRPSDIGIYIDRVHLARALPRRVNVTHRASAAALLGRC